MTSLAEPRQTVSAIDLLINLIVKRLLPMFLKATDGDAEAARLVATEAINAHCARNAADLLAVALIVACGMASLDNVIRSMADEISNTLRLRLQGTTNALNRTMEQNRRFLRQDPPRRSTDYGESGPEDAALEAAAIAGLAEAQRHFEEARAMLDPSSELAAPKAPEPRKPAPGMPAPGMPAHEMPPREMPPLEMPAPEMPAREMPPLGMPAPAGPAAQPPQQTVPDLTEHEKALIWAKGMHRIAAEYTESIPYLPRAQRRGASLRATALSSTASALIAGTPIEPLPRLKPR